MRQVEGELASVKAKIAAITKKLEQLKEQSGGGTRVLRKKPTGLLNGPADLNATKRVLGPSLTTNHNGKAKEDGEKGTFDASLNFSWLTRQIDDYKTALSHATSYVRTLATMPRTFGTRSPPPTGVSSPLLSASSVLTPGFDGDIDRARADLIHSLVSVMQRNIRIRYEMDIVELIKA
jgi:rapamycin-insensitive companion of mTOR